MVINMRTLSRNNLTEYIVVQEQTTEIDDSGGYKKAWRTKYQVWAYVESLFNKRQIGHELAIAKQIKSANYYEVSLRHQDGLHENMRIIWRTKTLNVVNIIGIDSKNKFLRLIAEELG